MGLDMMLYRFKKVDIDTTKTYTEEELYHLNLNHVAKDEAVDVLPEELLNDFARPITVEVSRWDLAAIYKAFQKAYPDLYTEDVSSVIVPDPDEPGAYTVAPNAEFDADNVGSTHSSEGSRYTFVDFGRLVDEQKGDKYDNHPRIEIAILNQEDADNFTIKVLESAYVYKTEEVAYQRKGLNDYGWSLLPENCTYSTDLDIVKEMVEKGDLSEDFLDEWVDGETAFYAWW